MPKISYRATFADGEIVTRKSERPYSHAWRTSWRHHQTGETVSKHGFARTAKLAASAAKQVSFNVNSTWSQAKRRYVVLEITTPCTEEIAEAAIV